MSRHEEKLVAIAIFSDRELAEQAWSILNEADIAAAVIGDPGPLGGNQVSRVEVARRDADRAQRLIAPLVN